MNTQGLPIDVGVVMQDLLAAARQELRQRGIAPGLSSLVPGSQVAWDNCCEDQGQLWVRITSLNPTMPFPTTDSKQDCGVAALAAHLAVGVVRCVHALDDNGVSPSAEEMTSDTLTITRDANALLAALRCRFDYKQIIGTWQPFGPRGGCAGGEWSTTVALGTEPC